jgi:hypothetical protein
MSDHACHKVAQAIIRLIAFALAVTSFLLYTGDILAFVEHQPLPRPAVLALKGVPFLAGIVLAIKSRALAGRLTRDMD